MMGKNLILAIGIVLAFHLGVSAQEQPVKVSAYFFGPSVGVVSLPSPAFPEGPKRAGLSGPLTIRVTLDSAGNVIKTEDVAGPLNTCKSVTDPNIVELREAAVEAAKLAKFQPQVSSETARSGIISYEFLTLDTGRNTLIKYSPVPAGETLVNGHFINDKGIDLRKPPYPLQRGLFVRWVK